ncbi:CBS domain-containing protein, partial [Pseudomonas sp. CrR14]|nr:CBS domain-containing protein [Pseudomonas sp. CrR14]
DDGLHCLPVLDSGALVGVITQTDLVAALHRDLLRHLD